MNFRSVRRRRSIGRGLHSAPWILGFGFLIFMSRTLAGAEFAALGNVIRFGNGRQFGGFAFELTRVAHNDFRVAFVKADLSVDVQFLSRKQAHVAHLAQVLGENYRRETTLAAFLAELQQVSTSWRCRDAENFSMNAGCCADVLSRFLERKTGCDGIAGQRKYPKQAHRAGSIGARNGRR